MLVTASNVTMIKFGIHILFSEEYTISDVTGQNQGLVIPCHLQQTQYIIL